MSDEPTEPTFEGLLADPYEQFDRRSEVLKSIVEYAHAEPAAASGVPRAGIPGPGLEWSEMWAELTGYVSAAVEDPSPTDAAKILEVIQELKERQRAPIKAWMENLAGESE